MKIKEMIAIQKNLDDFIKNTKKLHNISDRSMTSHMLLAMLDEIYEVKEAEVLYVSRKITLDVLIEEIIDVLHFMFSIAHRNNFDFPELSEDVKTFVKMTPFYTVSSSVLLDDFRQLNETLKPFKVWSNKKPNMNAVRLVYVEMLSHIVSYMSDLGYTSEMIEEAYMKKHEINMERQKQGY